MGPQPDYSKISPCRKQKWREKYRCEFISRAAVWSYLFFQYPGIIWRSETLTIDREFNTAEKLINLLKILNGNTRKYYQIVGHRLGRELC